MKRWPCVYQDTSTKGGGRRHDCFRADIEIEGRRYRYRNKDYAVCHAWLEDMKRRGAFRGWTEWRGGGEDE
jgi:hypothetical protein